MLNPREKLLKNLKIIFQISSHDFKQRYTGNYIGFTWAFVGPLVTLLVLWFVFEVGFRSVPKNGVPFILWFSAGMVPWFFIQDALQSGAGSILEKPFLVKKMVFPVQILPVSKSITSAKIHLFFIGFLFFVTLLYTKTVSIYALQLIYYFLAIVIFSVGISIVTASLAVFSQDIIHLVQVILQFLIWLSPIFWSDSMMPEKYRIFLKLNPVHYLVQGYRDSIIGNLGFWEHPLESLYFWVFTAGVYLLGIYMFKKLRPHFADVI